MRTGDAGATWTKLSQLSGETPTALHFLDAQTGWVAVAGEGIFKTADGGATLVRVTDATSTIAIAAADESHVWAAGDGLVGTVDATGDTAPPASADAGWHSTPQVVALSANDIGGAGPSGTQYSLDMGETWQDGVLIPFDAPADDSNDGVHRSLYRSSDLDGNREATQLASVCIDTLGPDCAAPKKAVVNTGSVGILRFIAHDATSGAKRAIVTISDRHGKVVRTIPQSAGNWGSSPAPRYYWLRFRCDLKVGYYRIAMRAVDRAGNEQTTVGRNWLHVVRSGAPKQTHPSWPAGLPDTSYGGWPSLGTAGSAVGSASTAPLLGALASHSTFLPRGILAPDALGLGGLAAYPSTQRWSL